MKVFLHEVDGGIPAIYDWYWHGKQIPINVWVVMENA